MWGDPFRRVNSFWAGIIIFTAITVFNLYHFHYPLAWDDWAMCIPGGLFILGHS